jgi:hypothetical protein
VPIDDEHHWKFQIMRAPQPLDREKMKRDMLESMTPDYHHIRTRENRYQQDREEMKTRSVAGLGPIFQNHDNWATEGPGPMQDRSQEHIAYTDKAIFLARQLLLRAVRKVQAGEAPPHVLHAGDDSRMSELVSIQEVVPSSVDWRTFWKTKVVEEPLVRA